MSMAAWRGEASTSRLRSENFAIPTTGCNGNRVATSMFFEPATGPTEQTVVLQGLSTSAPTLPSVVATQFQSVSIQSLPDQVPTVPNLETQQNSVVSYGDRVNLHLSSEEFDDTVAWSASDITITPNDTTAPNGATTADKLTEGSTGSALLRTAASAPVVTPNVNSVVSVYIKRNSLTWIRLIIADSSGLTNGANAYFNLATGTPGSTSARGSGTNISSYIVDAGNGWYRCVVSCNLGSSTAARLAVLSASADGGGRSLNSSYWLWGAQVESNRTTASQYIPTTTASTARGAEVSTPSIASLAVSQSHLVTSAGLATSAPSLASVSVTQGHALSIGGVAVAGPTLPNVSTIQNYSLAVQGLSAGSPGVPSISVSQSYSVGVVNLIVPPLTLGNLTSTQVHSLVIQGEAVNSPTLPLFVSNQVHSVTAASLTTFGPTVPEVLVVQDHSVFFTGNRTNLLTWSQDFSKWTSATAAAVVSESPAPDGTFTAWDLTDSDPAGFSRRSRTAIPIPEDTQTYTFSIFFLKTSGAASAVGVNVIFTGGTQQNINARLNTNTGVGNNNLSSYSIDDFGTYWRMRWQLANNGTNNLITFQVFPATGPNVGDGVGSDNAAATGTATVWGAQVVASDPHPAGSYIRADAVPASSLETGAATANELIVKQDAAVGLQGLASQSASIGNLSSSSVHAAQIAPLGLLGLSLGAFSVSQGHLVAPTALALPGPILATLPVVVSYNVSVGALAASAPSLPQAPVVQNYLAQPHAIAASSPLLPTVAIKQEHLPEVQSLQVSTLLPVLVATQDHIIVFFSLGTGLIALPNIDRIIERAPWANIIVEGDSSNTELEGTGSGVSLTGGSGVVLRGSVGPINLKGSTRTRTITGKSGAFVRGD